jgi:hypothetical protein
MELCLDGANVGVRQRAQQAKAQAGVALQGAAVRLRC